MDLTKSFFSSSKYTKDYNTPIESHQNEKDPEAVQVWNCIVKDELKGINWYYLFL